MRPLRRIAGPALIGAGLFLVVTGCGNAQRAPLPGGLQGCRGDSAVECADRCERGHAGSCTRLGDMVAAGRGVRADQRRALWLYERACERGDKTGCAAAGLAYLDGRGARAGDAQGASHMKLACEGREPDGPTDDPSRLLSRACNGGEVRACTRLGTLIAEGNTTQESRSRAATLYWQGCGGGDMAGCAALGEAYLEGNGLTVDRERGVTLLRRACEAGEPDGCQRLVAMGESR